MRTIELVTGIKSSALGFGCAPILGSVDGNTGKKALEIALDYGVTHFDLARSYGYGQAEKLVGKVMATKRDKVILTSKFGIEANWMASLMGPVKPLVRMLKKKKTHTADSQASTAGLFHHRVEINSRQMRRNLEKSLSALNTDYLDYFLIHEPLQSVQNMDELSELASRLKQEGKIRAWGLAFMKSQQHLHEQYLNRFDILQFNHSPNEPDYQDITQKRSNKPNIFFSPLKGGSQQMSPKEKFKRLFQDYPQSVILCSMFNERHLRENIQNAF